MNDKPEEKEERFRMKLYAWDILRRMLSLLNSVCLIVFSLASIMFFALFIYYIGFQHTGEELLKLKTTFRSVLILLFIARLILGFFAFDRHKLISLAARTLILTFCLLVILSSIGVIQTSVGFWGIFKGTGLVIGAGFLLSILEVYRLFALITSYNFPPSLVFSSSFLLIILFGAGMLMLPNSREIPISLIDTLFTSASAVCVTGLSVVDTETAFTLMGKIIILFLIQIGGLGMMTFTGFFSYVFTSKSTLQERMLLQDIFSAESLGNLFKILVKIVLFTFLVEALGAAIIYISIDGEIKNPVFFSIFHSVSAFCNAGFSTLSSNMMGDDIRRNYLLLSAISVLIILGGLGFPVILKLYSVGKHKIILIYDSIQKRRLFSKIERFDASSKIAITTTLLLIILGTVMLFLLENKTSLSGMSLPEKLFQSYFNSVTARTAGFNMSDLSLLGYPSVFLMIGLMWIGASPGSTGGGIKTSTFTVAIRSAWSNIRGRKCLEIAGREISQGTISRVLSIITLSILVISSGFFGLLLTEHDKNPVHLLFETVSAYSTVGLSLAGTPTLSGGGKVIIILIMFVGRVGPLTLLTGLFISGKKKHHSFPSGDILIN